MPSARWLKEVNQRRDRAQKLLERLDEVFAGDTTDAVAKVDSFARKALRLADELIRNNAEDYDALPAIDAMLDAADEKYMALITIAPLP